MRKYFLSLAAGLALVAAPALAQTGTTTKLEVSHFPGGGTWPISRERPGLFRQGEARDSSRPGHRLGDQIKGMMAGTYDIGLTALDNIIAYQAGQGEAPLDQPPDLFVFMGGEAGSMHLIAPAVKRIEDSKARRSLSMPRTQDFAFVLYRIAAMHGLKSKDQLNQ